jgi:hypothetical protein
MGKAIGAMGLACALGATTSTVFGAFFGTYAEAAAVSFMGLGLLAGGQLLGTKLPHPSESEPLNHTP